MSQIKIFSIILGVGVKVFNLWKIVIFTLRKTID